MSELTVKAIEYIGEATKSRRKLRIKLSNGRRITAESCYESWQQWGGDREELWVTVPVVEAHNEWLHGGARPYL